MLPAWANDPHDFITKHRQALESEYVSAHLHEWVDLVFGHKQRGPSAEAALNVFYHLTYEGAVDLEAIEDPRERVATESQISNFGNTPSQLMTKPLGARRLAQNSPSVSVCAAPAEARLLCERQLSRAPILALSLGAERIVCVGADRRVSSHRLLSGSLLDGARAGPVQLLDDRSGASEKRHANFGVSIVDGVREHPGERFALSSDGRHLFSCGYWDRSVKCSHTSDGRTAQSLRAHTDVVSCLALSKEGGTLVTGSRDTTLMVWAVTQGRAAPHIAEKPRHVLQGHDDEVLCVVVSSDLNTVLSGSRDGSAIIYTLRSGQYMRSVQQPDGHSVDLVALSASGGLVLYSLADNSLHSYTINHMHGQPPLASARAGERLSALCFSAAGDILFSAGDGGAVILRRAHDLNVLHELRALTDESPGGPGPLRCLKLSGAEDFVLAGTQRGTLLVWSSRHVSGTVDQNPLSTLDQQLVGFGL